MSRLKMPHPIAEVLWLAWFGNAVVAVLEEWPARTPTPFSTEYGLTGVVIGSFLLLELIGYTRSRGKPWGGTFSEVVWYRVPLWPLRWLLGTALGVAAWAMVSPIAGFFLIVWLGSHFAFRTTQERAGRPPKPGVPLRDIQKELDEAREE